MRKLLLAGAVMLLPLSAHADIIWQIDPMTDTIDNLTLGGTFTTDVDGMITSATLTEVTPAGTDILDSVADGWLPYENNPTDFYFADTTLGFGFELMFASPLDGSANPDAITSVTGLLSNAGTTWDTPTDVFYTDVPEPVSMSILAVGLAGMTVARRRRFL